MHMLDPTHTCVRETLVHVNVTLSWGIFEDVVEDVVEEHHVLTPSQYQRLCIFYLPSFHDLIPNLCI